MDIRVPPCDAAQLSRGTRSHPRLGRLYGRARPPVLQPGRPPRPRLAALPRGTSPGPMPRLTARTAAARRRQILDAATACFSNPGQRPGLSPGAVYCGSTGKEAIIDAVADERHARERDMPQAATTAADPRTAFRSF